MLRIPARFRGLCSRRSRGFTFLRAPIRRGSHAPTSASLPRPTLWRAELRKSSVSGQGHELGEWFLGYLCSAAPVTGSRLSGSNQNTRCVWGICKRVSMHSKHLRCGILEILKLVSQKRSFIYYVFQIWLIMEIIDNINIRKMFSTIKLSKFTIFWQHYKKTWGIRTMDRMIALVKTIVSENGVKVPTDNKERNWQLNISGSIFLLLLFWATSADQMFIEGTKELDAFENKSDETTSWSTMCLSNSCYVYGTHRVS